MPPRRSKPRIKNVETCLLCTFFSRLEDRSPRCTTGMFHLVPREDLGKGIISRTGPGRAVPLCEECAITCWEDGWLLTWAGYPLDVYAMLSRLGGELPPEPSGADLTRRANWRRDGT
jgi:hypothetical protein